MAQATISLSTATLTPSVIEGNDAAAQSFTITNTGTPSSTLSYSVSDNQGWLSCAPDSGNLDQGDPPHTIDVTYTTAGLAAGTHTATITVTDASASNSPQTITVNLIVQSKPVISLSPTDLNSIVAHGYNAVSQSFTLTNNNGGEINPADLAYSIAEDSGGWIASVTPNADNLASGDSHPITVVYNTAALAPGDHSAVITVSDVNGNASSADVTVNMTVKPVYTLTISWAGSGTGTVQASASNIQPESPFVPGTNTGTSPMNQTYELMEDDVVTLSAVAADASSIFKGFDGDKIGITPVSVTMDGDKTVEVEFRELFTLTINWVGAGTGSVDVFADTLMPGSPFVAGSSEGTAGHTVSFICEGADIISLDGTAADASSIFKGFDGDKTGITPVSVTMDGDKTVEVEFRELFTLTINWVGAGTGSVDVFADTLMPGSPFVAGSSEGTAGHTVSFICEGADIISLDGTAADASSIFKGFDGDKTGITPVSVTMDGDKTVEVEFRELFTLTINWVGAGTGSVDVFADTLMPGSPFVAGSSSGSGTPPHTSSYTCEDGDIISLDGTAALGSVFQGFDGDSFGASPIDIEVTGNTNVTARFSQLLTLTIDFAGAGSGTTTSVNASDAGGVQPLSPFVGGTFTSLTTVDCLEGDVIRLEASDAFSLDPPETGSRFKGWIGDVVSPDYVVDITINTDSGVTAVFNATYTLEIRQDGTGAYNFASVTAGPGSVSGLPGGTAPGTYIYELGDTVEIVADDPDPTRYETGSDFEKWTPSDDYSTELGDGSKTLNVTINDDLSITGHFIGKYMIWAEQRPGGTLSPDEGTVLMHGESQAYSIIADHGYVNIDVVVDRTSLGAVGPSNEYVFNNVISNHEIVAIFRHEDMVYTGDDAGDEKLYKAEVPPLVLLVMGRDHKLYYEAYNDASDLNGDGNLDVGYNPNIDYYGYFDSYKVYTYSTTNDRFEPLRVTEDKKVDPSAANEWSGDFLNYVTMSRMDVMRKVLYGGYRSIDTVTETELMRSYIPQDAHSWGKEYESIERDGYDIRDYTPLDLPLSGTRHLLANTTLGSGSPRTPELDKPRLRVLTNSPYRIWEWVSIERPVAGSRCVDGSSGPLCTEPADSEMTDYLVKVLVGVSTMPESNCKRYPSGVYKPTGLLQQFGEPGKMLFGLLSGSYQKNLSGGVLRSPIGPITDEINLGTGQFKDDVTGIIKTIDRFRTSQFRYDLNYSYHPGWPDAWVTTRPINEGEMKDWGNPIAEMMYEGLRYFAGEQSCTSDFDYSGGVDADLGLPKVECDDWEDPFAVDPSRLCAKPFMLVISDINPSYDSTLLPGVNSHFGDGLGNALTCADGIPFNARDYANLISDFEGDLDTHYMGQVGGTFDSACTPKDMSDYGFGDIRGLCPEEPTKQGSYYSAAVAHFGRSHKIGTGEQHVLTYAVALASPLPRIEIPVGDQVITLVPFGKSVGGCLDIHPDNDFHPTNTIVDFYVESITPTSGTFRINYEDVEQGADHDMDAIVFYSYQVLDDDDNPVSDPALGTKVEITLESEYAAGCIIHHIGYIISGTAADGTYLEVRDEDTSQANDVNYFLDTPPTGYRDGGIKGLPLTATRVFTPGDITAATLLENPLWYAAKWGGFNDTNNNLTPDLDSEWDAVGDGEPDTYFYVVNPLKLEQQLTRSFIDIISRGSSHVAPVVSVDEANRTQSGDRVYMAFFKPMTDELWQGNLKKYGLDYLLRDDCDRTIPEWTIVDQEDEIAGECDGSFKPTCRSFWSSGNDGGSVDQGGVGERLLEMMPGSPDSVILPGSVSDWWGFRKIYTYVDGEMKPFVHANISNTHLGATDDQTRFRIINFMHGYTYDSKSATDPDPVEKRRWVLGDIIHSEPRLIDYLQSDGTLEERYIVVGANDGMLHVFDDETGDEIFAFIPPDLLPRLQEFSDQSSHLYMVDGPVQLLSSGSDKTLVFGLRRGGISYWALDASDPDPLEWTVKWSIIGGPEADGGTPGFQELAQSWSRPTPASLRIGPAPADPADPDDNLKKVFIFAGGYDIQEDGFPEAFNDINENGMWDEGEPNAVTIGGTEDYDYHNPDKNRHGRGIFVVDADTGDILFKATYGEEDITTGIDQKYSDMKFCFPADISVIPLSANRILMYAADVYGNIWKINYNYFAEDPGVAYDSDNSSRWTVKRIFASNPGSDMPSGDWEAFPGEEDLDDFQGRKAFYSPDVSLYGNEWTNKPVLYFGTGDREHPRYTMISNRFYVVSDDNRLIDERALLNLTCNELDTHSYADADAKYELKELLYEGSALGFYKVLDKQGLCPDAGDGVDHTGQHVLARPTLFFKNIYFTTYQPTFDDPCEPSGNAFIYALDYSFGTSTFNYNTGNDPEDEEGRDITDTYRVIEGTAIPSGVRVITREGKPAGLVSVGGSLVGAGEEGSTIIPGELGGITPILWETD